MSARLRSLFLGSKPRIAATVGLVVVGLLAVGALTGVLGVPSVGSVDNRFGAVNESTTVIHTTLVVRNPNPFGLPLGGLSVEYGVTMNGIVMANGTESGLAIGPGNTTLSFATRMHNDRIPAWWVSHLQNGERTTLAVDAEVHSSLLGLSIDVPRIERTITTDLGSAFDATETRPIDADRPIVSDPVLYLNETSGSWGTVTRAETPVELSFVVYNPKPYPIPVGELGYEITMNGITVGTGQSSHTVAIPPKSRATITTTAIIDNSKLDEWWVSHLRRNQVTTVRIEVSARIDLSEFGAGAVRVPLDAITHTIETDFFGNADAGNAPPGADSGPPSAGRTPTAPTTEPTTESTAANATTPTEDEGLL